MREFDLVSIDWETVRLLQAGQFKQETFYTEELVRWVLQRGRIYGVLHMADGGVSRPSPEGDRTFSVMVRGCIAVAEGGRLIEIPDDEPLQGVIEARTQTVPLYAGVSILERSKEPEIYPTIDTGLLQCGGRRMQVVLAADNSDSSFDWLQIAQFEKTTSGLSLDPNYLPECMFLSSHGSLWERQREIRGLAAQCLTALEKNSSDQIQVYTAAIGLCGPLGSAARTVDERMHPHAYLDRLTGVIAAQWSQLRALPKLNLTLYQQALDQLDATLSYMDGEWTLGRALFMARECFERLLRLYGELLQHLVSIAPPPPRVELSHETVISAGPPTLPTGQQQTARTTDPEPNQPRRGTLWRR